MAARRRNAERSSAGSSSLLSPMPCETGMMLFARTSSGSFEVVKIIKVDSIEECCYALFENGKKHWVPFADIQKKDLALVLNVCCLCQRKARSPSKPLLRCISCHLGFHRKCHNPFVHRLDPEEFSRWQCQICIYASSSSSSSTDNDDIFLRPSEEYRYKQLPKADESSSNSDAGSDDEFHLFRGQKKLSYTLSSLTWDKNHLSNSENRYCYCGRPGKWDDGMLRCTRCLQWFHRGCISLKTDALVAGDLLYFFFCSICFKDEFYYRLQVTWKDLAHLALYNLSREQDDVDFFDFESDVMPWVRSHWRNFHAGKLNGVAQKERERNLLEAMEKNPSRFEQSLLLGTRWHLKEEKILNAPDVDLGRFQSPPGRLQMEQLLKTLIAAKGCDDSEDEQPRKRKQWKVDAKSNHQMEKKLKSDTSEPTSSSTDRSQSASVNYPTTSKRTRARHVLDEMIPAPSNYDGVNHPFKTAIEREDEMKTLESRRKTLNLAIHKIIARFEASADSPQADAKNKEQERAPARRSVAGELFNFNGMDVGNRPKRRKNSFKKNVTDPFLEDNSDDGLEVATIRYFGPSNMKGRVIGKRTIEGSKKHQLLVEWRDADRT